MFGKDPFSSPSQARLAVAVSPHASQPTPSLSPEKHIMQTRVAVRDKTPHRFQVVPLREISKQKDSLDEDPLLAPPPHTGTIHRSPSVTHSRSPTKDHKDHLERMYRDRHWRTLRSVPRSIPLSQVMDLTKPTSPTPTRPPPPRGALSELDPNQPRSTSRVHVSKATPMNLNVSLGLQKRKKAPEATSLCQLPTTPSHSAPSSAPIPEPELIPLASTARESSGTVEPSSLGPVIIEIPSNAMIRRTGRRKGRTMSENALTGEVLQNANEDMRARRRHAMYRQSLHVLDITRDLDPSANTPLPEQDEGAPDNHEQELEGDSGQRLGYNLVARSRHVARSIFDRAMGEPPKKVLSPETYTQPLRWKFPKRTVRRVPSFDEQADLGPLPPPTEVVYSPIILALFEEIDKAIEEWNISSRN